VALADVHVGDTAQQALSMTNTAANDGFSESLNASIGSATGNATASGAFTGLAAGATDNSSLVVGIDTSTAGAKSGTASIGLVSDGTGINSLGQTALAGQTVSVSGDVYRLAEATIDNPLDFVFGNVQVGDTVSQSLSISNTAANDGFSEGLSASFGGASDARITNNAGSIGLLGAGGTDNTSMVVGVDTSTAGAVSGTQTINFASDGTGTSGLGITGLDSQDLTVTATIQGGVFRLANPVINNTQPVAFGNFREGDAVTAQAVSITNDVPDDGFSEALNAQAAGNTGGVLNNGGSFALLGPSATDNTSITVSIDTSTAGDKSGASTIDFESDGTGSSGLGITPLPSQDVSVTGQVFRLAEAGAHTPEPVVINARVGDTAQQALSMTNTAANDGFSESLNASIGSATGNATAAGAFNLLGAGATNNSNLVVAIDTSSAGAKSGTATISLESDGAGTSNIAGNAALPSQTVNVSGNVWAQAEAEVQPDTVDFGIVHVGDSVASRAVAVSNTATGALTDVVQGGFSAVDGPFNGSGNLGAGVAAGDTDNTSLSIGLDTGSAGVFSGTATLGLVSHDTDLADLALPDETVALAAQVNDFANPTFTFLSGDGTFSGGGDSFLLDFGTIQPGSAVSLSATLSLLNDVLAPADSLSGIFDLSNADLFVLSGFDDFSVLVPGASIDDLIVSLDTTLLGAGLFTGNVILDPTGFNESGFSGALDPVTLAFRAQVVPVPAAVWLFGSGFIALFGIARRRRPR
jgi:hypothetical protein